MRKKAILEKGSKLFFFLCALFSIGAVLFICYFIFANAIPAIQQVGLWEFLSGNSWQPNNVPQEFGIFNMIVGSVYVTAGRHYHRRAHRAFGRHLPDWQMT